MRTPSITIIAITTILTTTTTKSLHQLTGSIVPYNCVSDEGLRRATSRFDIHFEWFGITTDVDESTEEIRFYQLCKY